MKKVWKALKSSPNRKQEHSRQQLSGTESLSGKSPPSLHDGTIYTSSGQPLQEGQQQQQPQQPQQQLIIDPPPRVIVPNRTNGNFPGVSQQAQHHVVYVNEQGHRVTSTTVRVPPPPPAATTASPYPASSQDHNGGHYPAATHAMTTTPAATTLPPNIIRHVQDTEAVVDPIHAANEITRTLVKKFIADIWNRGEIDLIPDVCSPNLRLNGNTGFDRIGHDGLARMVATIRDALDDYHCEIHSMVVEHNKAFCRLRFTGKHTGQLLGYAPTHKTVAWMGATEFTCQNGKILKVWELGDVKSLEEQLQSSSPLEEDEI